MGLEILYSYFPEISEKQREQFRQLEGLYREWNAQINVISRKDIDALYIHHVLHSLGIAKVIRFKPGSSVLDVGTGGGFPGIPLAIMHPETDFLLIDAIGKKIKVVHAVTESLGLTNVKAQHIRADKIKDSFDFVVSRAVTNMPDFVKWVRNKTKKKSAHDLKNGILYLKGGDLTQELQNFPKARQFELSNYFKEDFFTTKKVVHIPLKYKG